MAEQQKYKSPEELGEAVGKKIEELFGGLFGDDEPEIASPPSGESAPVAAVPAEPAEAHVPPRVPSPPPTREAPHVTARPSPAPSVPRAAPAAPLKPDRGDSFDSIVEQIEILVLSMEWEVNPQSANKLAVAFRDLGNYLPQTGQAKTILAMNLRVLQHFGQPDAVPHPVLMRFLQDSIAALKTLYSTRGKRSVDEVLISGLTKSYKEIMSGTAQEAPRPAPKETAKPYATLVNNMGNLIHSLEEVGRRLARILGVLRQGGKMSGEEITRRLGTLETLLSERLGEISACHKEMSEAVPAAPGALENDSSTSMDGLWLMVWAGIHIAIPSSLISGVYPLAREQAQQLSGHRNITLGTRPVQRLLLKKPEGVEEAIPNWLVHISSGDKDFFVLADRTLGFRCAPEGLQVDSQQRIKVGPTSYAILNRAILGK